MKKLFSIALTIMMATVLTGCYSKSCGCPTGNCPMAKTAVK